MMDTWACVRLNILKIDLHVKNSKELFFLGEDFVFPSAAFISKLLEDKSLK